MPPVTWKRRASLDLTYCKMDKDILDNYREACGGSPHRVMPLGDGLLGFVAAMSYRAQQGAGTATFTESFLFDARGDGHVVLVYYSATSYLTVRVQAGGQGGIPLTVLPVGVFSRVCSAARASGHVCLVADGGEVYGMAMGGRVHMPRVAASVEEYERQAVVKSFGNEVGSPVHVPAGEARLLSLYEEASRLGASMGDRNVYVRDEHAYVSTGGLRARLVGWPAGMEAVWQEHALGTLSRLFAYGTELEVCTYEWHVSYRGGGVDATLPKCDLAVAEGSLYSDPPGVPHALVEIDGFRKLVAFASGLMGVSHDAELDLSGAQPTMRVSGTASAGVSEFTVPGRVTEAAGSPMSLDMPTLHRCAKLLRGDGGMVAVREHEGGLYMWDARIGVYVHGAYC
jgi:hypothetical protein